MRNILFKGQRIDNSEWVEGCYAYANDGHGTEVHMISEKVTGIHYPVIPETVCEFTGVLDKNNNNIFEGDYWIDDEDYAVLVVDLRDAQYCFVVYEVDTNTGCLEECDCIPMKDFNSNEIEIIGNIHNEPKILRST